MKDDPLFRKNAIAAGVLFIVATAFLFVGAELYTEPLQASDAASSAVNERSVIGLGILIEFACVLAIPLIPVVLFPVLSRVSIMLAVGYLVFRLFEATLFAALEIDRFLVVALSEAFVAAGAGDAATLNVFIAALVGGTAWSNVSGPIYNLVFMTGAWMLYVALWSSRLIPRWISGWGMVSVTVLGCLSVAVIFAEINDTVALLLILPLAVQEMVMAVWFIAKGFNAEALGRLAA